MIYKILKHSLSCLPICQECTAARILGVVRLLWVSPGSLPPALPWQRRTPESARFLKCRSPLMHQPGWFYPWRNGVALYLPLQGSDFSKMLGWKVCQRSIKQSAGGCEWKPSLRGFCPLVLKGTVELSSLLHPPQPCIPTIPSSLPWKPQRRRGLGSSWHAQNPRRAFWKHRFLGSREFWFRSSVVNLKTYISFPPTVLKYNWHITLDKFKVYSVMIWDR